MALAMSNMDRAMDMPCMAAGSSMREMERPRTQSRIWPPYITGTMPRSTCERRFACAESVMSKRVPATNGSSIAKPLSNTSP